MSHDENTSAGITVPPDTETLLWSGKKNTFFGQPWTFTRYTLFNDRFMVSRGLLTRHQEELRLYRIKDIVLRQSLLQRLFGLGTLTIHSTDASTARFQIVNIKQSERIAKLISDSAEAERVSKGLTMMECFDTLR